MVFDWQTIAVALIVAGAFFYVARRGLARLRSFRAGSKAEAGCETGCVLIQISPPKGGRRKSA